MQEHEELAVDLRLQFIAVHGYDTRSLHTATTAPLSG